MIPDCVALSTFVYTYLSPREANNVPLMFNTVLGPYLATGLCLLILSIYELIGGNPPVL